MRILGLALLTLLAACDDYRVDPLHGGLTATPDELDFGTVWIGHPRTQKVELIAAARPLRLTQLSLADPAFRAVEPPRELAAGTHVALALTFDPSAPGARTATLAIHTDVPGAEPLLLRLTGEARAVPSCDDGEPCTVDAFDPETAACTHVAREGTCDDGSACTTGDRCAAGACVGEAVRCDDGVACTQDLCDPAIGCTIVPNHTACADADPCTLDTCTATGCENPDAPDGTACGPAVACTTANICILHTCIEVAIPEGVRCDDGDPCTVDDRCAEHACRGAPDATPPIVLAESFRVPVPDAAALVGDRVYLSSAPIALGHDRMRTYVLEEGATTLGPATSPLDGDARLIAIGGPYYTRIGTSTTGVRVEVIEAVDPARPHVVGARDLAGARNTSAATVLDGALFFCLDHALTYVDVRAPASPGPPVTVSREFSQPCAEESQFQPEFVVGDGPIWITALQGHGSYVPGARVYRVSRTSAEMILDNGWNPTGVHQYGDPIAVALSATRAVIELSNPRLLFWVSFARESGRGLWHMAEHRLGTDAQLLDVDGDLAWFFERDRIRGLDLHDPLAVAISPVEVPVATMRAPVRLLASDPARWILASADGELRVIAKPGSGAGLVAVDKAVVGLGGVDEWRPVARGLGAFSASLGAALYDERALHAPTATATPALRPSIQALPALVDDGNGGLFVRRYQNVAGCDRALECSGPTPFAFGPMRTLAPDLTTGGVLMARPPSGVSHLLGFTARGCDALALDDGGALITGELCARPLAFSSPGEVIGRDFLRPIDHGGHVTFMDGGGALLVSRQGRVERAIDVGALPFGAGYDEATGRWVITALSGPASTAEIWVLDAGRAERRLAAPELDQGGGAVLSIRGRMVLVSGHRAGDELLAYDLERGVVVHRVPLTLPALSVELGRDEVVVGRADGVTVLGPICMPR